MDVCSGDRFGVGCSVVGRSGLIGRLGLAITCLVRVVGSGGLVRGVLGLVGSIRSLLVAGISNGCAVICCGIALLGLGLQRLLVGVSGGSLFLAGGFVNCSKLLQIFQFIL